MRRIDAARRSARVRLVVAENLEQRTLFSLPPGLNGAGVSVAQVEADFAPDQFEVNPAAVNQPASLFTYTSDAGSVTGTPAPNIAGTESGHADGVGSIFYGNGTSYASGVKHVYNYEVNYFINNIITATNPPNIPAKVINQSFVATDNNGNDIEDPVLDQAYDNYIARYNKIIVSSAGNSGITASPSTSYNGISVGSSDSPVASGPTLDGRSKPDISAPGGETSFTAPQVAAAAAVLVQAGQEGYGGWGTSFFATDSRTIKALLLNGADKPANWTHTATMPLDPRYGAGAVDVSNSLQELEAGIDPLAIPTMSPLGSHAPLPAAFLANRNLSGWNFDAIASTSKTNGVNHYEFNVTDGSSFNLTATLVWNRNLNQTAINNLDLYLYNIDTHTLVSQSISPVDNVEHLFTQNLAPGHYEIEVVKNGGTPGVTPGDVSNLETYALAFNFAKSGTASPPAATVNLRTAAAVVAASGAGAGFQAAAPVAPFAGTSSGNTDLKDLAT